MATMYVPYSGDFYQNQSEGSARSAQVICEWIVRVLRPESVADVGCGVGTWLSELERRGVVDLRGYDGDYVPRDAMRIAEQYFVACDIRRPPPVDRTFDVALCLEVAEHLPEDRSPLLIDFLVQLSPIVVFSAAIPGQGGTHHVNEQWPSYWADLFRTRGYRGYDPLRLALWSDERIEWWYRQNILIFARTSVPLEPVSHPPPLVHPMCLSPHIASPKDPSVRSAAADLRSAMMRSLRRRMRMPKR